MERITTWLAFLAVLVLAGCDDAASAPDDGACAQVVCPNRISCATGQALVVLEGACCPSCETLAVDAGEGCPCNPQRDPVCGEDLMQYLNACFASCAGVEVLMAGSCPSRAEFPEGDYGEPCDDDDACDSDYECLPAARGETLDPEHTTCATRCEGVEDCPKVISDHCGDQTLCTGGICGFSLCQ